VKNERNLGLFGNFNRCIEVARGEYLHILHSDDYIDLGFTETCMAFFRAHPSVVMTSTRACIVCNEVIRDIPCSDTDFVLRAPEGFRRLVASRSFIASPSVMIRRDVYREVGSYSLEYPYSSDYYQYLKIARAHDIGFVRGACVYYRQGEHSESFRLLFSSPQGYMDMLRIFIQIQMDLGNDLGKYAADFHMAQHRFIYDSLFAGFTRADAMPGFSPWIFSGFALTCWTLEKPVSVSGWLRKFLDLLVILPAGLLMSWSPTRWMVRALFFSHSDGY
jgi:glycosyltransferase involved in cell wall biosynthesis